MRGSRVTLDYDPAVSELTPGTHRLSKPFTDMTRGRFVCVRIVTRIARHLERRGLLVRDAENSYLSAGPGEEDGLAAVVGHSITYRIAVGPNEGRKAFTLQTLAPALEAPAGDERLAKHSGFSLHAGVAAAAGQGHRPDPWHRPARIDPPHAAAHTAG